MSSKSENDIDQLITEGLEAHLVEAIRKHPLLYNKGHRFYLPSNYPEKHAEVWNKISDELHLELESCKTLWSCIKQKFIKYRKKVDNGGVLTKNWPIYENLMEWLDPHVKKRRTKTDLCKKFRESSSNQTEKEVTKSEENEYVNDVELAEWYELATDEKEEVKLTPQPLDTKARDAAAVAPERRQYGKQPIVPTTSSTSNLLNPVYPKKKLKLELKESTTVEVEDLQHIEQPMFNSEIPEQTITIIQNGDTNATEFNEDYTPPPQSNSIKISETPICKDVILEANFDKLEQVIEKCVGLAEKCLSDNINQDSNEIFGKLIASMIRELPQEKRMKVRYEILQFTGNAILKA